MSHQAAPQGGQRMTTAQRLLAPGDGLRQWWSDLSRPAKWMISPWSVVAFFGMRPLYRSGNLRAIAACHRIHDG